MSVHPERAQLPCILRSKFPSLGGILGQIRAEAPMKTHNYRPLYILLIIAALAVSGCQSVYYNAMEKFGQHKRDILVRRVDDARDSQEEAKEQFQTALERFIEVTGFTGGNLRAQYNRLESEFDRSETRAQAVTDRIASVEDVAKDLFAEWNAELGEYSDRALRRRSEQQLRETRSRYDQLISSMRQAEARMEPVLDAFRDRVLFLKHNLNAQAIASLEGTTIDLQRDIQTLIEEMDRSIQEANAFIDSMREAPAS